MLVCAWLLPEGYLLIQECLLCGKHHANSGNSALTEKGKVPALLELTF